MIQKLFIFFLFLFSSQVAPAQFERDWVRYFTKSSLSEARSIIELSNENLLVAGYSIRPRSARADAWLILLDQSGKRLWEKSYGGKGWDEFVEIVEADNGDWVAIGWTDSEGAGKTDAWLVRISPTGELLWEKTFGDKRWDEGQSICKTSDGGFVLGMTFNPKRENNDFRLIKVNASGDELWRHEITGVNRENAHGIRETADSTIVFAGFTGSKGLGREDGLLAKLSPNGKLLWEKTFGTSNLDAFHDFVELPNKDLVAVGFSRSHEKNGDLWLVKTDKDGNLLDEFRFGGNKFEKGRSVVMMPNSQFAVTGFTTSEGMGKADTWALVFDFDFKLKWKGVFGGEERDSARSIVATKDGGFALAGKIDFSSVGAFLIIKYILEEKENTD